MISAFRHVLIILALLAPLSSCGGSDHPPTPPAPPPVAGGPGTPTPTPDTNPPTAPEPVPPIAAPIEPTPIDNTPSLPIIPQPPIATSDRASVKIHDHDTPIPGAVIILHGDSEFIADHVQQTDLQGTASFDGLEPNKLITISVILAADVYGPVPVLGEHRTDIAPANYLITTFVDVKPGIWDIDAAIPYSGWPSYFSWQRGCENAVAHITNQPDNTAVVGIPRPTPDYGTPDALPASLPICLANPNEAGMILAVAKNKRNEIVRYGMVDPRTSTASQLEIPLIHSPKQIWWGFASPKNMAYIDEIFVELYGVKNGLRYAALDSGKQPNSQFFDRFYLPDQFPMDLYVYTIEGLRMGATVKREQWMQTISTQSVVNVPLPDVDIVNITTNDRFDGMRWELRDGEKVDYVTISRALPDVTWNVYVPPSRQEWRFPRLPLRLDSRVNTADDPYWIKIIAGDVDEFVGYHAFTQATMPDSRINDGIGGIFDAAAVLKNRMLSSSSADRALIFGTGSRSEVSRTLNY